MSGTTGSASTSKSFSSALWHLMQQAHLAPPHRLHLAKTIPARTHCESFALYRFSMISSALSRRAITCGLSSVPAFGFQSSKRRTIDLLVRGGSRKYLSADGRSLKYETLDQPAPGSRKFALGKRSSFSSALGRTRCPHNCSFSGGLTSFSLRIPCS
jgi:hypothetical protein